MQAVTPSHLNGIDTAALRETVNTIQEDPRVAGFQFRARNRLVEGGLNRSEIGEFHGALQEHRTGLEPFVVHNDEPPALLSGDEAPNPAEYLLQALLGCMTTTTNYKAAAKGMEIESITSEIEGDLDVRGMLELDPTVPPGYREIRATIHVKGKDLDESVKEFYRCSPVYDTVTRPVNVKVQVILEE